ncbi:MAG: phospho-N-acetylmuramoyl-pentapeptide-transferase [Bacteroidaceae bacterium]|nr:phospho-N-acetylmuramoyl-pentapeptide-transferase [Bacteroidaceae bacterium]
MLYELFKILQKYDIPGSHLLEYTSFRALVTIIAALLISTIFGEYFIRFFRKHQISETLRDIDKNNLKRGVPTMGGIIVIVSILVPCLLIGKLNNVYMILLIVSTVWLGIIGFIDDYIKTFKKNKDGIPGKVKVIAQVALGLIIGLTLYLSPQAVMRENIEVKTKANVVEIQHRSTPEKLNKTTIPFIKNHNFNYNDLFSFCGKYANAAGWIFFVVVTIFIVTAVSNGANINDGMDGMLAGNAAIMGVTLAVLAYVSSHVGWAEYLNIMYLPGSEEIVIFTFAFIGALIGFLWYNSFPAQVFMGDTGSLTIGGIIAVVAILLHKEILLVFLCATFVVENLSVIMQTAYFKIGKRKGVRQRIFRCAPLHHHYTISDDRLDPNSKYLLKGPSRPMHEAKVTIRFWIVTIIMAALTLMTLKIR